MSCFRSRKNRISHDSPWKSTLLLPGHQHRPLDLLPRRSSLCGPYGLQGSRGIASELLQFGVIDALRCGGVVVSEEENHHLMHVLPDHGIPDGYT